MSHQKASSQSSPTKVYKAGKDLRYDADFIPEREFLPAVSRVLLDIGCGGGDLVCFLAPQAELMVGMDISLDVLEEVAKKARQKELHNVHLLVADVNQLPFKDESIDGVLSRYVLHHTDLNRSLPEVRRILLPGGQLFLRDIFARWPGLEKYTAWQLFRSMYRTALHTITHGWGSGL